MTSPFRLSARAFAIAAFVGSLASSAGAQGPSQTTDPAPAASDARPPDGARLLAANVARLTAANAPRTSLPRVVRPFTTWSASAQDLRDSILVSIARTTVGTRYVRGGRTVERGFDCSGLVQYIMTTLRVPVPRTAAQQAGVGLALGRDTTRLRPGDLLTFGRSPRGISHVGIYLGNGRFVHASSVAGRVIESDLRRPPAALVKPWRGTRRVLSDARAKGSLNDDG
jgi:cell wall-associated NlpC family hydrolase